MAVLVEGISVIVRRATIDEKFPGGWEAFKGIVPNRTLCSDDEVARVGFLSAEDVQSFVAVLEEAGFQFVSEGTAVDIAVADQKAGFTANCSWAEFGHIELGSPDREISACRLAGSSYNQLVAPAGWQYEGSLSESLRG
ncbi:hypothetical protein L4X63_04510 [Geomonas sp. Red32]|uniref:hypothetical protein n=1 Tax=Geomonas sp. Red32 TaxID=2912856 RepID=UPI00202D060C|nr:hypothetical protein [Geomonas sp. Red32]MCM0080848.1 hypothetical protein [Geomonas sp. Red32]